jgi:hypothetical protein
MKRICIKVAGSERGPIDVNIEPGMTSRDVLPDLELEGYWLSVGNSGRFLGDDENLYKAVEDGDVLFALAPAVVAAS